MSGVALTDPSVHTHTVLRHGDTPTRTMVLGVPMKIGMYTGRFPDGSAPVLNTAAPKLEQKKAGSAKLPGSWTFPRARLEIWDTDQIGKGLKTTEKQRRETHGDVQRVKTKSARTCRG